MSTESIIVWAVTDGKPGHENQIRGLLNALAELHPTRKLIFPALPAMQALGACLLGFPRVLASESSPNLIICAGHKTHLTALATRRQRGGQVIVLMKPSLPMAWFDLCLIPEHDGARGKNVVQTKGAINAVAWTNEHDPNKGLILLGGPSRHAAWNSSAIYRQVKSIVAKDPRQWTILGSRRTPNETMQTFEQIASERVRILSWHEAPPYWLQDQFPISSVVWVTEDSVSMIYEAMSSGSMVGLLQLPESEQTKVRSSIGQLAKEGLIVKADDWLNGKKMARSKIPLQEAQRCAKLILQRFFDDSDRF